MWDQDYETEVSKRLQEIIAKVVLLALNVSEKLTLTSLKFQGHK